MKKKLIILDFDDTLTDNSERDLESFQNIAEIFHLDSIDRQDILNWRKKNLTSEFIIMSINFFMNNFIFFLIFSSNY